MNVNNIHNATFAENLPPTFLAQARALANWHEYNVFTSVDPSGIGNSMLGFLFGPRTIPRRL